MAEISDQLPVCTQTEHMVEGADPSGLGFCILGWIEVCRGGERLMDLRCSTQILPAWLCLPNLENNAGGRVATIQVVRLNWDAGIRDKSKDVWMICKF